MDQTRKTTVNWDLVKLQSGIHNREIGGKIRTGAVLVRLVRLVKGKEALTLRADPGVKVAGLVASMVGMRRLH